MNLKSIKKMIDTVPFRKKHTVLYSLVGSEFASGSIGPWFKSQNNLKIETQEVNSKLMGNDLSKNKIKKITTESTSSVVTTRYVALRSKRVNEKCMINLKDRLLCVKSISYKYTSTVLLKTNFNIFF